MARARTIGGSLDTVALILAVVALSRDVQSRTPSSTAVIGVIFKAWKSHLKFDVLHRVSACQLRILLHTRLLVIAAASNLYRRIESVLWLKYRRRLSLLKFMKYLA